MGERKVQAKYYPPDFDPSKLPRIQKKRPNDDAVRFMLPMSVRCETCGEFMGTGLKFNARKSDTNDNYLGIRIFRFTMKCKACPATFVIRTDPKNSDYSCESGVRRNYEPWREAKAAEDEGKEERKRQDEDAMQKLENKTIDAKQEMDDLDALDQLKTLKAKRAAVSVDHLLKRGKERDHQLHQEEERLLLEQARHAFEHKRNQTSRTALALPAPPQPRVDPRKSPPSTSLKGLPPGLKLVKKIRKRSPRVAKTSLTKTHLETTESKPLAAHTLVTTISGYEGSSSSDED